MDQLAQILSQLATPRFGINFLDVIIVVILLFYAYEGYVLGFILAFADLISFVMAFTVALKFYGAVGEVLATFAGLPIGMANAIGFFLTAFSCEIVFSLILRRIFIHLPSLSPHNIIYKYFKKVDHYLGLVPGMISAFIVLAFLLTVIVALPSSPLIKQLVTDSQIGGRLIANTSFFEKKLNDIFGGALNETLNFLTVQPQSSELVDLQFTVTDGTVDSQAEQEMLALVNEERVKAGLSPVTFDERLAQVARAHSRDMFERGYFSHYTPEGTSPFDRMDAAEIQYTYAGENLALAPTTKLAMQGLMNSPGHRANILNANFKKLGVGVIDGEAYGKMYSQEFTD